MVDEVRVYSTREGTTGLLVQTKIPEVIVLSRKVGAPRPVWTFQTDPKAMRNGVPIRYPVRKYFVVDPNHGAFAREITYDAHGKFRTSYTEGKGRSCT
jgi:hypothetical protein